MTDDHTLTLHLPNRPITTYATRDLFGQAFHRWMETAPLPEIDAQMERYWDALNQCAPAICDAIVERRNARINAKNRKVS